ncbi:hypothetical protein RMQ97_01630 [Maricaulis sp. D1M11]|uniref:hypothetical protein n=1 Tax=Maricaulis sp. D1M11 TaxID=3076117 RepID=UPI0039B4CCD1
MKRVPLLVSLAVISLSACTSGADTPHRAGGQMMRDGSPHDDRPGRGTSDPFTRASVMVEQGRYRDALPVLRCYASLGRGYEIAEYLAGVSALALADDEATPPLLQDEYKTEGLDRLTRAAQAGWPAAQSELAMAYWAFGTPAAHLEAAFWARVYRSNRREILMGLDRLDASMEREIETMLDDTQKSEVQARADAFQFEPLAQGSAPSHCQPLMAQPGSQRGGPGARGRGGPSERRGGRTGLTEDNRLDAT